MNNKIWRMCWDDGVNWDNPRIKPRYAQSSWSTDSEREVRCARCRGVLFEPEKSLLIWEDYHKKIALIFNECISGFAMHKWLGELLSKRFTGLDIHPLYFEYAGWLLKTNKNITELSYDGPEVCILHTKNRIWTDFSNTGWTYTCQCSQCGRINYTVPETADYYWSLPYFKVPFSQIRGKDFFRVYGGGLYCTSAFRSCLDENNVDSIKYYDAGEIYDDNNLFVPPVLPEWPQEKIRENTVTHDDKPKRMVRRKTIQCEELDPATIQTIEDIEKYNIKIKTPENESEATCPKPIDELKDYIKLELSGKIRRMRFLRVAEIQGVIYWLWKLYDEGGTPCYAFVSRSLQGNIDQCVADVFKMSPDQFLYSFHYDLYNKNFD